MGRARKARGRLFLEGITYNPRGRKVFFFFRVYVKIVEYNDKKLITTELENFKNSLNTRYRLSRRAYYPYLSAAFSTLSSKMLTLQDVSKPAQTKFTNDVLEFSRFFNNRLSCDNIRVDFELRLFNPFTVLTSQSRRVLLSRVARFENKFCAPRGARAISRSSCSNTRCSRCSQEQRLSRVRQTLGIEIFQKRLRTYVDTRICPCTTRIYCTIDEFRRESNSGTLRAEEF